MTKFRIKHNVTACIGCGNCAAVCPSNWKMEGDKAKPIKTEIASLGCNKIAAEQCPVKAIEIIEVKQKVV